MTDQAPRQQIYRSMDAKTDNELIAIWMKNDRAEWSDAAFDAIKEIIISRNIRIPLREEWKESDLEVESDLEIQKSNKPPYVNLSLIYWKAFGGCILFLVLLKYFTLKIDPGLVDKNLIQFIIWVTACTLTFIESERISRYLKKNYYEIWHDITYFPFFGTQARDTLRFFEFIVASTPSKDKNIEDVKHSFINAILIFFLLILALIFYSIS
ncbi:MAG TPA: hypothetical protein VKF38_02925 [Anaerolineaceae bacterium]|nr:hypothetical protein [Anaerolineaceae bacterium]